MLIEFIEKTIDILRQEGAKLLQDASHLVVDLKEGQAGAATEGHVHKNLRTINDVEKLPYQLLFLQLPDAAYDLRLYFSV
jgi:hypothetical protein